MGYHDQLVKCIGKIPFTEAECPVKFCWKDPFTGNKSAFGSGSKNKIQMTSGEFELLCVEWNVAAMLSQVASAQDSDDNGMQTAVKVNPHFD